MLSRGTFVTNIAVIFYSATGNVDRIARSIGEGADSAGADVRVRRVVETAPDTAIDQNERWRAYQDSMAHEPVATLDDIEWADGLAFGSPTRFGAPAAQLKALLDSTGGLWAQGRLIDKVVTGFTSASTGHGGLESTVLALLNTAYHWGSIVLPLGYTDATVFTTGNPYGTSWVSRKGAAPDEATLATARHQGARLADVTARLHPG
ncbi:MAG: NAD(P)H:quinone oxidoreductase [Ilumatobacteraceae bacterium]